MIGGIPSAVTFGGECLRYRLFYIYCIGPVLTEKLSFLKKKSRKSLQIPKKSLPLHPRLRNNGSYK